MRQEAEREMSVVLEREEKTRERLQLVMGEAAQVKYELHVAKRELAEALRTTAEAQQQMATSRGAEVSANALLSAREVELQAALDKTRALAEVCICI